MELFLEYEAFLGRAYGLGRQGSLFVNGFPVQIQILLSLEPTLSSPNRRKFELFNVAISTFQS